MEGFICNIRDNYITKNASYSHFDTALEEALCMLLIHNMMKLKVFKMLGSHEVDARPSILIFQNIKSTSFTKLVLLLCKQLLQV